MNIKEPVRVLSFEELNQEDKIWTVDHSGKYQIITYICILPNTGNTYAIFLNENKDGIPKFHHYNLLNREWYKYDESDETWYHIYKKVAEHYESEWSYAHNKMLKILEDIENR